MPELLLILRDVLVALADWMTGRSARRYEYAIDIAAPRELVWAVASARTITFEGLPPISVRALGIEPAAGIEMLEVRAGGHAYRLALRQIERREGVGEIHDIVPEHTDRIAALVGIERTGYVLADDAGGTRMTMFQDGRGMSLLARINTPIAMRIIARRIAETSRSRLAAASPHTVPALPAPAGSSGAGAKGLLLAVLSFAAFWYMSGLVPAILLMAILLLHELGHVLAMRFTGLPVHGIYFVPFVGAVAVGRSAFRSDFEHGFIALMGPLLSLVPTLLFLAIYNESGSPIAGGAALLSAAVNGFNLLPILPLDGGHVAMTAVRAIHPALAQAVAWLGIAAGAVIAFALQSFLLGAIIALAVLGLFGRRQTATSRPRMSGASAVALFAGFIATFAIYAWVLAETAGNVDVTDVLWPEQPAGERAEAGPTLHTSASHKV